MGWARFKELVCDRFRFLDEKDEAKPLFRQLSHSVSGGTGPLIERSAWSAATAEPGLAEPIAVAEPSSPESTVRRSPSQWSGVEQHGNGKSLPSGLAGAVMEDVLPPQ